MSIGTDMRFAEAWAAAWSSGDPGKLPALFTEDCVYEDVTLGVVNRGSEELRAFASGFMGGVPDFKVELTSSFVTGDRLSAEWRMTGTHTGDLPNMPATGRKFDLRGASVFELEGGKGKGCRDYWDMATLLKQIGLMS
jgi:steroid delta-isomerase-like uncharacterized protein